MTYEQKASEIIKESIKSAIFIDEKALDFYKPIPESLSDEEELSINLFHNFKKAGISLQVHKYEIDDEKEPDITNFLFNRRDLTLLDWKLEGVEGQDRSLKLLSDIVSRPSIHFCVIYTSETGGALDNVYADVLSYFSNLTSTEFEDLRMDLESIENITELLPELIEINLKREQSQIGSLIGELFKSHGDKVIQIKSITKESDQKSSLIKAAMALSNNIKSEIKNPCPSKTDFDNKTVIINNTIITILNKEANVPDVLIKNMSKHIVESKSSLTQLLGLEFKSIYTKSSAFDDGLLRFDNDALLYHRNNYVEGMIPHLFPEFIKEIAVENVKQNIQEQSISLLDDTILGTLDKKNEPNIMELVSMNVFYNSFKSSSDKLNFGDVFKNIDSADYYICITALCDCLRPDTIENKFFFAKGSPIKLSDAMSLGDTAFISYLSSDEIVKWTDVTTSIKESDHHKFSPVYIKPLQFSVFDLDRASESQFYTLDKTGVRSNLIVKYISTIRSNYAQRIANHAFNHPIRVGVDFVKK